MQAIKCISKQLGWPVRRYENALLQNEALDVFTDSLQALVDDEGLVSSQRATHAREVNSFSDMAHSKGRAVVAVQWLSLPQVPALPSAFQSASRRQAWSSWAGRVLARKSVESCAHLRLWRLPQGCLAMACSERTPFSERMEKGGAVAAHAILVWSPAMPLQPQQVRQRYLCSLLWRLCPGL